MSNEELVAVIQAGEDRMGELWEQVDGLVKWKAKRIMTILESCPGRGVESAMLTVPKKYREILHLRYWEGLTLEDIGQQCGVSKERIRQMENKGIRVLRQPRNACYLRPFVDFDFYCGTGLGAFQHTGMSIQERYLVMEEEARERESRRHQARKSRRQKEDIQSKVRDTMERISREAQEKVSRMTPEEKRALLEKYGYA